MASWRLRSVVVLAGCCMAALASSIAAQTAAERAAYMAGLRIDRGMLAGPLASSPRSAMSLGGPSDHYVQETHEVALLGKRAGLLVEMPRMQPDGTYQRPRLLLGRQSPELDALLKEVGLPPDRCMLPMLRGRLKRQTEGETSRSGLAVLVTARCTFF
jgi:hypothetical protein